MKALLGLFLTVVATSALAAGNEPATTPYDPAQPLDIARRSGLLEHLEGRLEPDLPSGLQHGVSLLGHPGQ